MSAPAPLPQRAAYRVRQFFLALWAEFAPPSAAAEARARALLPAAAWPLFTRMSRGDRRHSLQVLADLEAAGRHEPALLQAALLHDCAKAQAGLWQRVLKVLLAAFLPGLFRRWQGMPTPASQSWRYPFWAYLHHAELGADLARAAGCLPLAVWLIEQHQDGRPEAAADDHDRALLAALRRADNDH